LEIVAPPEATTAPAFASPLIVNLETRYIEPVASKTFKEFISPTPVTEALKPGNGWDLDEDDGVKEYGYGERRKGLGLFAHKVMEAVGNGCLLAEIVNCGSNGISHCSVG